MNIQRVLRVTILLAFVGSGSLWLAVAKPEEEAQKATEQWLALIDAGNFAGSWKNAAGSFQKAVTQEQWEHSLGAVRQPLGNLVSRKLKSAKYTTSLPGAPDGQYVILQFNTSFTNKKEAVETIAAMMDKDGLWKASGYYIK